MELEAADLDLAKTLVYMKQSQIDSLEAAALTLLNLNNKDVSDETLIRTFENTTIEKVVENAKLFSHYGIIPEIELDSDREAASTLLSFSSFATSAPPAPAPAPAPPLPAAVNPSAWNFSPPAPSPPTSYVPTSRKQKKAERAARLSDIGVSKQFQGKTYDDLNPYLRGLDVCQPRSASQFMKALFPAEAVSIWTEVLKKNCRQIYEPGSVESQCNNTIGKVRDTDKCYICGFDFDEKINGLQPTCEHILPIIQAIFFLDLFRSSDKGNHTPQQMDILRKEYAWAHRCCNYVKADNSFLVTKIDRATKFPRWEFGVNQTTKVLSDIHKTYKYDGTRTVQALINAKGYDVWLQERLGYINTEKMNPIVKYISDKGMGGTIIMIGFANCVDSTKMNDDFKEILQKIESGQDARPEKKRKIGGKTFRRKNNGKFSSTSRKGRS
jgi:hypothetical protein